MSYIRIYVSEVFETIISFVHPRRLTSIWNTVSPPIGKATTCDLYVGMFVLDFTKYLPLDGAVSEKWITSILPLTKGKWHGDVRWRFQLAVTSTGAHSARHGDSDPPPFNPLLMDGLPPLTGWIMRRGGVGYR